MIKVYPSQEDLWRLVYYEYGQLKSKSKCGKWLAGRVLGCKSAKGRWTISISGTKYYRAILVYIYFYGTPKGEIDHLDRDKINDKIENLEDKSSSDNCINRPSSDRDLPPGVYLHHTGGFTCAFRHKNLGVFPTIDEARNKYLEVKGQYV